MKKILCVFLAVIILIIPIISVTVYVDKKSDILTAEDFADKIKLMMRDIDESVTDFDSQSSYEYKNEHSDFQSCRLIVKSTSVIDTQGATKVISGYNNLWVLAYDSPEATSNAFNYYSSRSGIDYVEPDKLLYALETESSGVEVKEYISWAPKYIGLNKLNNTIFSSGIELTETVVAVLDTGTDETHPAFKNRVIPTGVNTSTSGEANSSADDNGHGTQVTGVIIDSTLDNVKVRPYKVLDQWGQGTVLTLAAGIICAVNDGVDVINMSISLSDSSETLKEAVNYADSKDIVLVAASGNDSSDTKYYPASYECVIKVGAINEMGTIANFSTRGEDVDLAAPGVGIYTTNINGNYKTVSGTSFASPLVAALAATIRLYNRGLSSEDVRDILFEDAIYVQETDSAIKYGNGIVRAPEFYNPTENKEKTSEPRFSHTTKVSQEEIYLEIFCDTPDSVIYYTTDRTVPSKTNPSSVIYDGNPIHIPETTVITAVAYGEGRYRSPVSTFASIIVPYINEKDITVDASGVITAYHGSKKSFTVPNTINGTTVTAVGDGVFEGMNISEIVLPKTVKSIGKNAFKDCTYLKTIFATGVTQIADYALYNCVWLKNIYFGKLTSIGKYSYAYVCSGHYSVSGTTFPIRSDTMKTIDEGAFQYSAVSDVDIGKADTIGKNAFLSCPALVSVKIDGLSNISNEVFRSCASLSSVEILGLSFISSDLFNGCKSLTNVHIPDATYVNARAFEGCISLEEITLESAATVYSSVFNKCTSLRIIVLPEMTSFESAVYRAGTTTFPMFSSALQAFIAPKLSKTSAYMFGSAPNIVSVSFKNLKTLADYTLSGCKNIMYLNIQSVTSLSEYALADCKINFIDARSLKSALALPDNSGIMLSKNFTEHFVKASNLIIYGSEGSVAESFANEHGHLFKRIPCIYNEIPQNINSISGTVVITAVGFDLTYQWYSNTVNSNEGGTPIEGATSSVYTFTEDDTAYYYYCVITQNDFGDISDYHTDVIIKDPKPANYERYNLAVNDAKKLNPDNYINYEIVADQLSVDVSGKRSCEQKIVDAQAAAIRNAITKLTYKKVNAVTLSVPKNSIGILKREKINVTTSPYGSVYKKIEWSSDNTSAFVVAKNGYVRCIGEGSAYIIAKVTNYDGSVVFGRIKMTSAPSSWIAELFASCFKFIYIFMV